MRVYDFTPGGGAAAAAAAAAARPAGPSATAPPPVVELRAHSAPLAAATWSNDGGLLATTSAKGTLIRVWALPAGARAASLRRGATRAAVTSLAFGPCAEGGFGPLMLAAASSHGTVHVFSLPRSGGGGGSGRGGRTAWAAAALRSVAVRGGPDALAARAELTVRLPAPSVAAAIALAGGGGGGMGVAAFDGEDADDADAPPSSATLYVATIEGALYEYSLASGRRDGGGDGESGGGALTSHLERELFIGRGAE